VTPLAPAVASRAPTTTIISSPAACPAASHTGPQVQYNETRERSAELLRIVIGHMGQHDAAFNPISYSVWYEYAAGLNERLNEALDRLRQSEPRLGDASIERLYREHIAGVDDKTMDRISRDFQQVMNAVADRVQRTGEDAGAFGAELNNLSSVLSSTEDPAVLRERLQLAHQHSVGMQASAAALKAQVEASRQEIQRLRNDLHRAREEVFVDSLTRVLNRKGLDHRLEQLLRQPLAANAAHSLVMVDIDHFKQINDTHGHLVGDQVLAGMGELLRRVVNGPHQLVARYGGEEFAVVLPEASLDTAAQVAERIRHAAKAMKLRKRNAPEVVLSVTVSAGAAALQPGESANDWIARADAALYRSKQSGRDRVSLAA